MATASLKQNKKPFQPVIGTDIGDVKDVIDAQTRGFLAKFVAVTTGVMIATTGAYALLTGFDAPVLTIWAAAGPLNGAVMMYYFGIKRDPTG